jgi:hypothetical protein
LGTSRPLNRGALAAALATGPAMAAGLQFGNYLIAELRCEQWYPAMFALVTVGLLATASACYWSWRHLQHAVPTFSTGAPASESALFLTRFSLANNLFFAVIIIAFAIPPAVLRDCH